MMMSMNKLVFIMLSVIAMVGCGNNDAFKNDYIVCFKNANAMTTDLALQLIKEYGKDAHWETTGNLIQTKLDSIVRAAYKPLVEKYGEKYIVEFFDRNLYKNEKDKYSKEEIEEYMMATIDGFYYNERLGCSAMLFTMAKGDIMKARDYQNNAIQEVRLFN